MPLESTPLSTPVILVLGTLPALLILYYYHRQDRRKPEPTGLIWKAFFLGVVFVFPVASAEFTLDHLVPFQAWTFLPRILWMSYISAAVIEEGAKFYIIRRYFLHHAAFDEYLDGVIYAVVVSLGFACFENVLYISEGGFSVAITRAFTAVPGHAIATGLMGYYIGQGRFASSPSLSRQSYALGLFVAILFHGTYNFLIFSRGLLAYLVFPLLILGFLKLRRNIALLQVKDLAEAPPPSEVA